ncbi:maleylpyruvate isomerase family mycothiol-dependent enzyme [Streptomyces albiaxialis]|uniref:Maleylpyruvate isomerase family mycothiol-dependent enzyme n=1 Tax=Streptomyces albiaxialis TaxID=329523 RepID=A0ABP5HTM0_9ACTN
MGDEAMRDGDVGNGDVRDAGLPGRLLAAEREQLMPMLRRAPDEDFALPTAACPGWTVRQVLAHCAAALVRIVENRLEPGVFSDASNAADVAERDGWPLTAVLDELEHGFTAAGPVIAGHEHGLLDTVALGEWVHAGDVREAWGEPGAYAGETAGEALALLSLAARRKGTPLLHATLTDRPGPAWTFGVPVGDGRAPARLTADTPTLFRLYADRPLSGARYTLTGAREAELHLYSQG